MALKDQLIELLTPAVLEAGFYLEDIHIATQEVTESLPALSTVTLPSILIK